MIKKVKSWFCSHGFHWFVCCGGRAWTCRWCGLRCEDNFDDFFSGMKMS